MLAQYRVSGKIVGLLWGVAICLWSSVSTAQSRGAIAAETAKQAQQTVVVSAESSAAASAVETSVPTNTAATTPQPVINPAMSPAHLVGQVVGGLLFVTVLIFVLAWLARHMGYQQYAGGRAMRVIAQLPLGNREKAVLIEVNGQQMLLGVAPGRVNFLRELDTPVPGTDVNLQGVPIKKGQEFARYLKSILAQGNKP